MSFRNKLIFTYIVFIAINFIVIFLTNIGNNLIGIRLQTFFVLSLLEFFIFLGVYLFLK